MTCEIVILTLPLQMARKLQTTLAFASFKTTQGWEDLTINEIEPRMAEQFRRKRPSSAGDILSDSSSSTSDFQYPRHLQSSSPSKAPIFSDSLGSSNGTTGHRKRTYNASFPHPSSNQRKRLRSSPTAGRSLHSSWKDQHQLAQSSPIKSRKHSHFTTSAGPNISFSRGTSSSTNHGIHSTFGSTSDDEDDLLPMHNFKMPSMDIRSSPPRTPPTRSRALLGRNNINNNITAASKTPKASDDGADLLLYLATSPSPAQRPRNNRMQPPSTPPQRNMALPSSMMTTPGGSGPFGFSNIPQTPQQDWQFSEFLNITPSPAQPSWKTPGGRTPASINRRAAALDILNGARSPNLGSRGGHGLGMQLGGELLP